MTPLIISVLGCGWLGLPLAERLMAEGYTVKGSTTTIEKLPILLAKGIQPYHIQLRPHTEGDLNGLLQSTILIIDIPPRASVQGDAFHPAQVQAIADAVRNSSVDWVIYVSSTSVYPELGKIAREEDVTIPADSASPNGSPGRIVEAEQIIQNLAPHRKTTILRCAGLMGYDRIPGKYVAGRSVDSGAVPVNYIHRDDAVALITAVIANKLTGVYNIVAPKHPTREAVYRKSCAQFGYALPDFIEPANNLPFKVISGEKLTGQFGYQFRYDDPLDFFYELPGSTS